MVCAAELLRIWEMLTAKQLPALARQKPEAGASYGLQAGREARGSAVPLC